MNRPIKFKAKRLEDGKWVYGDLTNGNIIHIAASWSDGADGEYWGIEVDPNTVCQLMFTHKGIDMYEYDKFENSYGLEYTIFYDNGFPSYKDQDDKGTLGRLFLMDNNEYEFLGNIHDKYKLI